MNLREAYEARKRERNNKPKKKWPWKESISSTLSVIAFISSGVAFYKSSVRQVDDLRVVAAQPPELRYLDDEQAFLIDTAEVPLLFLNSGNRPAAVESVELFALQPEKPELPDNWLSMPAIDEFEYFHCYEPDYVNGESRKEPIETRFDPVVIKPNDVVVAKLKIAATEARKIPVVDSHQTNGRSYKEFAGNYPLLLCLEFRMTTPSGSRIDSRSIAGIWSVGFSPLGSHFGSLGGRKKPTSILWSREIKILD
ncbi:hypothetical protein AB7M16_000013 [Bradyrhizobium sp. USDA 372]